MHSPSLPSYATAEGCGALGQIQIMLKVDDPNELRILIEEAVQEAKSKLSSMKDQIQRLHGPFWTANGSSSSLGTDYSPENTYFEYMTAMVPRMVYNRPRVRASSRRNGPPDDVARAIQHGLNRLVKDQRIEQVGRLLAVDMLFTYGVGIIQEQERRGVTMHKDDPKYTAHPTWPVLGRIPQHRFFMDPEAFELSKTRFRGHELRLDKDDLIKRAQEHPDEGWDLGVVRDLAPSDDQQAELAPERVQRHTRSQVALWEVWVPERELPESKGPSQGFHGTIYTVGVRQAAYAEGAGEHIDGDAPTPAKGAFVRAPRPFYGPRTGPYVIFGCYTVPNSPFPLSPLVACEGQITDLNAQVNAANVAMMRFKKVLAVDSENTANKVMAQDGHVIGMNFAEGKLMAQELEYGGHSDKQLEHMAITKERLNRTLGMDETMRGNVSGGATATEHALASESSQARIGEIQEGFASRMAECLYNMGHYMYHSETTAFVLDGEVLEQEGVTLPEGVEGELWFHGGDHDPDSGYTWADTEVEVEAYSMARTNEGLTQQRAIQKHEILLSSLDYMERFPDFPWQEHFKAVGEAMNTPGMEDMVPQEMLDRLAEQLSMMLQLQVEAAQGTEPEPMLSSQVKGAATRSMPSGGQNGPSPQPVGAGSARSGSQSSSGGGPPTGARAMGGGMQGQKSGAMAGAK